MGLTLALRLAKAKQAVTVIEAAPEIGGLASAWSLDGITWDRHYHVTLLSDQWTRGVVRELGLEGTMRWVETKAGFYSRGRLSPLASSIDYLRLPGLGLHAKLRIAATILLASRRNDWRRLERIPVETWLRRWSGAVAFERLWRPLLRAKLGDGYRDASAAFIWATIQRLYAARRTGLKKEMFGYVPGGYATVLERFALVLRQLGVRLITGSPVRCVARNNRRLRVESNGLCDEFDHVVVTTTPANAARICVDLPPDERQAWSGIQYQGIVCAAALLDRPLSEYYLTYLTDDLPFTAVVDMTAFVDPMQFGGHGLVYLPRYAHASEAIFTKSDTCIQREFEAGLGQVYPDFHPGRVRCMRISRAREVFPLPVLGYSQRLPAPTTSVPGLHIVCSAHIVNGTLNVNDTVHVAERAARKLIGSPDAAIDLTLEAA